MLDAGLGERFALIALTIAASGLLYFSIAIATGALDKAQLIALLRRRRQKAAVPGQNGGA
jgi:hypothetical protein